MNQIDTQKGKFDLQGNISKVSVLQLIRNDKKITRANIIKRTGLSAPTVARIIDSLTQMNLVQTDSVGLSSGGRPPQIVKFNSKDNFVIGIDIDATFIRAVLSNLAGEFVFEIHVSTNFMDGFEEVMSQVGALIEKLSQRALQKNLRLWGIGIAVSGMVNKNSGLVEYSPIFNWKNVDVRQALSRYTNLHIALGNVVDLVAIGELLYGIGKQYKNFICINVGYGIGSGIIIDGKLFSGADGFAGEIGHIVVDKNSKRKGMEGIHGTLEALASGYGIADVAREMIKDHPESTLHILGSQKLVAQNVFDAARAGDTLANKIVDSIAAYLCIGIDTMIKLFNTECIVLYGDLIDEKDLLLKKIRTGIKQYYLKDISRSVPVVPSSFLADAALMGSFSLILEKILLLDMELPEVNYQKSL